MAHTGNDNGRKIIASWTYFWGGTVDGFIYLVSKVVAIGSKGRSTG